MTGRIKDMMIVRGKNCFLDDIEKSLRRDLPILRGRRFVVFQNTEDLIYCFVEEVIEIGDSTGVPGLVRDSDDEVGSMLRSGIARSVAQRYGLSVTRLSMERNRSWVRKPKKRSSNLSLNGIQKQ